MSRILIDERKKRKRQLKYKAALWWFTAAMKCALEWINLESDSEESDDSEEFPHDNDDNSSSQRQSFSEATVPTSESSGSKRKSTDDLAGEGKSRKKRYKERYRKRLEERNKLVEAWLEIARSIKADTEQIEKQLEQCLIKIEQLGIQGPAFNFILKEIERPARQIWFLNASKQNVVEWVNRSDVLGNKNHENNNPNGYNAMLTRNQGMHAYPNPNHGGNNYGYPLLPHNPNF